MSESLRKLRLEELGRVNISEYKAQKKIPIVVILDNIRSAMNVGSVFRTCDAFAIQQIIICGISARPPHKEIFKTAIGATNSVDWIYEAEISTAIQNVKAQDYQLIGIEQTSDSIPLRQWHIESDQKYAICLGNEVDGISDEILPHLDTAIEISQFGTKHSLNVAVCGGIVLWHLASTLRASNL